MLPVRWLAPVLLVLLTVRADGVASPVLRGSPSLDDLIAKKEGELRLLKGSSGRGGHLHKGGNEPVVESQELAQNTTFVIRGSSSSLRLFFDLSFLQDIHANWAICPLPLKILSIIKAVASFFSIYWLIGVIWTIAMVPAQVSGKCKLEPKDGGWTVTIGLPRNYVEADHLKRQTSGFYGSLQIFHSIVGDESLRGPVGTFELRGLRENGTPWTKSVRYDSKFDEKNRVVFHPHEENFMPGNEHRTPHNNLGEASESGSFKKYMMHRYIERLPWSLDKKEQNGKQKDVMELTIDLPNDLSAELPEDVDSRLKSVTMPDATLPQLKADFEWPYDWKEGIEEGGFTWVLKNEGRMSRVFSWYQLVPILLFWDACMLMSTVGDLGNGTANPYNEDAMYRDGILLGPAVLTVLHHFLVFCSLHWVTDKALDIFDVIGYKFNQFGTLTMLQDDISKNRNACYLSGHNHYQDLGKDWRTSALLFFVQLCLTSLYVRALGTEKLEVLTFIPFKFWCFGVFVQMLVVADATSAGNGFFKEIPFWISLMQHGTKDNDHTVWFCNKDEEVSGLQV
jgi:hypothetical protein